MDQDQIRRIFERFDLPCWEVAHEEGDRRTQAMLFSIMAKLAQIQDKQESMAEDVTAIYRQLVRKKEATRSAEPPN
jgi:hypothetical protein